MRRDSRLSGVLHVLVHMAQADGPVTSEALARLIRTNPVVIRRIMGGLRNAGYVRSEKGHGGGWSLSCDVQSLTLLDVYQALGAPDVFALGNRTQSPRCFVEQSVNAALDETFREVEERLMQRLGVVALSQIGADFRKRVAAANAERDQTGLPLAPTVCSLHDHESG